MKKTKFIALALAVALMVMGAGYAYWTESVEINNTIKTGELKVEFETDRVIGETWGRDEIGRGYLIKPYFTGVGKKTMSAKLEDLYPTDEVFSVISVKITNKGTLAAKFDYAEVKTNATRKMKKYVNARVYINKPFTSGSNINWKTDQNVSGTLENLKDTIDSALNGIQLEPGESRLLRIRYNLDSSAPNALEKQTAKPEITLNWKQFNQN